ncbi:hypothetical protein SAY87_020568 [Trapa incisa]|uniref:Glycosyl transferase family 51 domain-containing protein n=1 Tax=Trapa incisa TaxID=236973 RepID=A0AAN7JQ10_9MYRT|nr:hypothetical protein SAY87_020568 [Trapa incisa]
MSFALTPSSRLVLPKFGLLSPDRPKSSEPISFSAPAILARLNSLASLRVKSAHTHGDGSIDPAHPPRPILLELFIPLAFSFVLLFLRLFRGVLLPGFPHRWRDLVALSGSAESRARTYPAHLWQAVVAYEDRHFFHHCGVDPIGIARATFSLSARGGGSTITQQVVFVSLLLVKNAFLRNERTLTRKFVEMTLALALERTMSKWQILGTYLNEIYWGHGFYGIESASMFYFGKHPSLLSFGESTILAGLIPAPEIRSPFRDPSRGVTFQVRVLKRMVEVGFLNVEMAIKIVNQPVHLSLEGQKSADDGPSRSFCPSKQENIGSNKMKHGDIGQRSGNIWDWEKESKIWEARENMERWAMEFQLQSK